MARTRKAGRRIKRGGMPEWYADATKKLHSGLEQATSVAKDHAEKTHKAAKKAHADASVQAAAAAKEAHAAAAVHADKLKKHAAVATREAHAATGKHLAAAKISRSGQQADGTCAGHSAGRTEHAEARDARFQDVRLNRGMGKLFRAEQEQRPHGEYCVEGVGKRVARPLITDDEILVGRCAAQAAVPQLVVLSNLATQQQPAGQRIEVIGDHHQPVRVPDPDAQAFKHGFQAARAARIVDHGEIDPAGYDLAGRDRCAARGTGDKLLGEGLGHSVAP